MAATPNSPPPKQRRKFIGFSQTLEQMREKQESRTKPQPWIARKTAVGIVLALWAYSYYVYLARFCWEPLVHDSRSNPVIKSRAITILFFVIFNLLWLMFGWSYFKILFTAPGYARDHTHPVPRPQIPNTEGDMRHSWDSDDTHNIGGPPYTTNMTSPSQTIAAGSAQTMSSGAVKHSPIDTEKAMNGDIGYPRHSEQSRSPGSSPSASPTDALSIFGRHAPVPSQPQRPTAAAPSASPPAPSIRSGPVNTKLLPVHPRPTAEEEARLEQARQQHPPPAYFSRQPPNHPVLLPEYRYCGKEGFIKPFRSHHCRICATCVLKYDHHCPWIGQCVGARNQKFFIIFLGWSTIFTTWTFATLLASNVKQNIATPDFDVDPQQIVIIAISGIFTLFTISLCATQVVLALMNATTVEHMNMGNMKERETAVLSRIHPLWALRARRQTRREWDQEWGKIATEGNIWWMGSMGANFRSVMGDSVIRWILPIGRAPTDGLSFPTNPRFDRDGRWRRRKEWPQELR